MNDIECDVAELKVACAGYLTKAVDMFPGDESTEKRKC